MATHSRIHAWRIPWIEEPGGLWSLGSHRVRHNWSKLAHAHILSKAIYIFNAISIKVSLDQSLSCVQLFATHGLQHARFPCPSTTPRASSNSCPSSWWCHPTISSSVVPFSPCLQSFPASGYFLMSQFFASVGQSTGASASTSVLPMNIQDWFPLGWTGWISFRPSDSQESSPTSQSKASILWHPAFLMVQLSHPYMTTGKTTTLTRQTFVG